jgi:hypothetical protein
MDKRTRNDGQGTSVSTGSGATSSSSSPHTRLQDVAIPEGATDDEEEDEHSSDDLSTASGSSIIIRTGDGSNIVKNLHEYPTVHADANMYTKCYMQRRVTRKGRPRYAVKHLRDFATKRNKFDAAIDLAVEATFLKVLKVSMSESIQSLSLVLLSLFLIRHLPLHCCLMFSSIYESIPILLEYGGLSIDQETMVL